MKKVIACVIVLASLNGLASAALTTIHEELFDDGSNIWVAPSPGSLYWGLSGSESHSFSNVDGQFFLGKEVDTGTLFVPLVAADVSGYADIQLNIALAGYGPDNLFESNDYLKIYMNGNLIEDFRGPNSGNGNLTGTIDTSLVVTSTFANANINIDHLLNPPTTAQLQIEVVTSVEHIGIDTVRLTGYTPTPGALLLGSIGIGLVGFLRRKDTI